MSTSAIADVSTAAESTRAVATLGPVPALTIISHPLAHRAGERVRLDGPAGGEQLLVSRNAPEFTRPGRSLGSPLGDPFVSRRPIRFRAGPGGSVQLEVEPGGTPVVVGAPVEGGVEIPAADLVAGTPVELADRVVLLLHLVERPAGQIGETGETGETGDALGMLGNSAGIRRVRTAIERVADLLVPVLIRGETGTGKELVARAIHDHSPRRAGPFVSVNLGAIPRELAAAELFGATRGAFTGATRDREGLFRAARDGTLFLDEVGEAPVELQAMLLRVLETGELYPVGADKPVTSRVRLIAATDANLEQQIHEARFKAPLLHRLAGYEVQIPPLRERRDDIGLLFHHFARQELEAIGEAHRLTPGDPYARPWLPAAIAAQLVRHPWPGNIRELRNLTRQLVIASRGQPALQLDPELAAKLSMQPAVECSVPGPPRAATEPGAVARRKASHVTEPELVEALRACEWDLKAAADRLRIPRPSIYDLIDRYPSIRTAGTLPAAEIAQCYRACEGDVSAMAARLQVSRRALNRRVKELGLVSSRSSRRDNRQK